MIKVSKERFDLIFKDQNKYRTVDTTGGEFSSYRTYEVQLKHNQKVLGWYGEGSWENTYKIIQDLASKKDIIDYYISVEKELNRKLEDREERLKFLRDYKALPLYGKLKYRYKQWRKRRWHRKHPGLFEFMEDKNIVPYHPSNNSLKEMFEDLDVSKE